jgi:hypothetical protein
VVTWPEGNGHLVRELTHRAGTQPQLNCLVTRVARTQQGIELDYFDQLGCSAACGYGPQRL